MPLPLPLVPALALALAVAVVSDQLRVVLDAVHLLLPEHTRTSNGMARALVLAAGHVTLVGRHCVLVGGHCVGACPAREAGEVRALRGLSAAALPQGRPCEHVGHRVGSLALHGWRLMVTLVDVR